MIHAKSILAGAFLKVSGYMVRQFLFFLSWVFLTCFASCVCLNALAAEEKRPPVPVTTAELGSLLIHPTRDAPATAVSLNQPRVSAEINGVIAEIGVEVGERVTQGQTLARLDCEFHAIEVTRVRAALEAGRSTHAFSLLQLENARRLSERRSISQEELDKRTADARTLKADLDRLQAALNGALHTESKCIIIAPLNAIVVERIASVGDYAIPGTPILRLLDEENIEISAKVQEQDLKNLQQAHESFFIIRNTQYPVTLRTVLPLIETRLRTHEVRLSLVNARIVAGSTGRLRWVVGRGQIPANMILKRGADLGVFVLDGEQARFVPLPEARPGHPVPIDLPAGTLVIRDGRYQLEDGDPVRLQ